MDVNGDNAGTGNNDDAGAIVGVDEDSDGDEVNNCTDDVNNKKRKKNINEFKEREVKLWCQTFCTEIEGDKP